MSFNRTFMELKSVNVIGTSPESVLIVPLWN